MPTNILARLLVTTRHVTPDDTQRHQEQAAIAPLNQCDRLAATPKMALQMRQNKVDFQNRELPTNILALLLVTTRRITPDDTQRHQEQTAIAPLNQRDGLDATTKMAA
jgi:hypothetical protein